MKTFEYILKIAGGIVLAYGIIALGQMIYAKVTEEKPAA